MSETESKELYLVDKMCFLCNHVFVEAEEPWYIFNKQIPDDGYIEFSISDLLSKVLEREISENTVHSTFLCEICNADLLEFESLEKRLAVLKERLKRNYEETNMFQNSNLLKNVDEEHKHEINIARFDCEKDTGATFIDIIKDESNVNIENTVLLLADNFEEVIEHSQSQTSDIDENVESDNVKEDVSEYAEEYLPKSELYVVDDYGGYICLFCNTESFSNLKLLNLHLRVTHKKRTHACTLCDMLFSSKKNLNLHIESIHVNSDEFAGFECEACDLTFTDFHEFRLHRQTKHSILKPYECSICHKFFNKENELEDHMITHSGGRPYKCHKCDKRFLTKKSFDTHEKIHTKRQRPYQCDRCQKSFLYEKNRQNHMKSHFDNKPYICVTCGKGFKSQHNLDVHNIVHRKIPRYICRICGKTFPRRSEFRNHERIHTGERPFKCDLCPSAFAQSANLSSHKKSTHFNEKLHKCEQCDRAFKRRRLLDYHIQAIHTGERPHKCDVCGMGFVYPGHLKKHLLIHTGLKPYACEVCGKKFKSRDNRNAHRFVHSDKKPYECLQCGAGFMRKPLLLQHMNNTAHATDTIIINQPQINNLFLKSDLKTTTDPPMVINQPVNILDDESTGILAENLDNQNLGAVKYLKFEDFDNDGQDSIAWMEK